MHRDNTTKLFSAIGLAVLMLTTGLAITGCAAQHAPVPIPALQQIEDVQAAPSNPRQDPDLADGSRRIPSAQSELPDGATLTDLIHYAEVHSPTLQAARADWQAAGQIAPQARSLPDPTLQVGYQEMDRETRIGVSQMFPLFGKQRLRGQSAGELAHAARQQLEAERRNVVREVVDAWTEYAYLHRAVEITSTNVELVRQLEQVAAARVRAGAPAADLIRAQVELDRIEDELRTMQDMLFPAAAQLNNALGRPADARLPEPLARPDQQTLPDLDEQQLLAHLHENPEILAMQREMTAARREMQLARRENLPDLMIGVDYMRQPDMDGFGIMASINIPIWQQRNRARVREAASRFQAAGSRVQEQRLLLEVRLQQALFRLRDSSRKIDLYEQTLLPRASQSLRATEAAYRAGAVDFLALVDAYRLPLEFELALARARADRETAIALIDELAGRSMVNETAASESPDRSQEHERRSR
jgi:outer membrane protein, heavy metal efflux system